MNWLGIDVGSVSTDLVVIDEKNNVLKKLYLKTEGNPIRAVEQGMKILGQEFQAGDIAGVGTTGSGRAIAAMMIGADAVKNEITAHGRAVAELYPEVRTVFEIGGQDSKIILIKDGYVRDFAMNTVCAAGTGSFLDRQAERMGIKTSDIGELALRADMPASIAGRCAVFAESDLIHKQQLGCSLEDIIAGMSEALVRNYLANVAKGKQIKNKICFQGGVAANEGIRRAFEKALDAEVQVPKYHKVMGAYGAAILAKEKMEVSDELTAFRGFRAGSGTITSETFRCGDCGNQCEVTLLKEGERQLGCFSDRCGKYQRSAALPL